MATPAQGKAAQKDQKEERVVVTFLKPFSRYSRGDIAGFPPERAKHLVEGVKVAVEGDKLPEPKKAE